MEAIPEELVEKLAILEHQGWVEERLSNGWVFGEQRDVEQKISPYLVPYAQLSEEVKEKDRDVIRNIPALLNRIGMAAYRKKSAPWF